MGKASRAKAARRAAPPPPVGKRRPGDNRLLLIGGAAALVVVAVVVVIVVVSGGSKAPSTSAADQGVPKSLVDAANKVGFHPNTEAGVGQVEGKPASAGTPPSNPNLLAVGTTPPNFTLKTPQGQTYSLARFRGKTVLLEFFATWCPHCDAEAPHLYDLYASLPKRKFQFLGVNADGEDAASVYAYHRYFGLQFPTLLDPSTRPGSFTSPGGAGPVTIEYQVQAFPTFYVIDPNGVIRWRSDGEQPDALLREQLLAASKK